jgi:hypothetical protein
MFVDRRPFGSPISGGSERVEDKLKDARNPNEKTLIIFTDFDKTYSDFGRRTAKSCADSGIQAEHVTVLAEKLPETIAAMRGEGKIGDGTQIIINMHGGLNQNNDGSVTHMLDSSVATYDVVEAVRKPVNEKGCSANIYITGCSSGNDELRQRLQELHKEGGGACFLMSSKKKVLKRQCHAELTTMIDLFRYAEANKQQPPSTHIVLTRMTSHQMDCISMVDRDGIIIRHAPKDESQFGLAGFIADIDERLRARTEPSIHSADEDRGGSGDASEPKGDAKTSDATGKTPASKAAAKPKLIASTAARTRLLEASSTLLDNRHLLGNEKHVEEQREEVISRIVMRASNRKKVEDALQSHPTFMKMYKEKSWNNAHKLIAEMIDHNFFYDGRITAKIEYLLDLMVAKKEAFGDLGETKQIDILESWSAPLLAYLCERNFFSSAQPWFVAWEAKNANIIEFMGSVEELGPRLFEGHVESLAILFLTLKFLASDDSEDCEQKLRFLCAVAPDHIGAVIQSKDIDWLLSGMSQYFSAEDTTLAARGMEPDLLKFLRELFHATRLDLDKANRIAKSTSILGVLDKVMRTWIMREEPNGVRWIINTLAYDPAFDGKIWDNCHYSLIKMLDGAYYDPTDQRRDEKVAICKQALIEKRELFLSAPNRQQLIETIHKEMKSETIVALRSVGFI